MKTPSSLLSLLLATAPLTAAPDTSWTLETGEPWQVTGKLKGNQDLSALDSLDGKLGLIASDEGSAVQTVRLDAGGRTMTAGESFRLLGKKQEADIEGIAAAPGEQCYYVTGSHAISRKKLELENSRYHIFRVRTGGATGEVAGPVQTASLRPLLESLPEIKPFVDQAASGNGVDIEGLAWLDGRLFVGFRAPVGASNAWILETTGAAVFDGASSAPKLHPLSLGTGTGIRALATAREGLYVLTGDSGGPQIAPLPALFFWTPGSAPVRLGEVPAAGAKPEALMVISEKPDSCELLMVSDGLTNGNPVSLKVSKAAPPSGS